MATSPWNESTFRKGPRTNDTLCFVHSHQQALLLLSTTTAFNDLVRDRLRRMATAAVATEPFATSLPRPALAQPRHLGPVAQSGADGDCCGQEECESEQAVHDNKGRDAEVRFGSEIWAVLPVVVSSTIITYQEKEGISGPGPRSAATVIVVPNTSAVENIVVVYEKPSGRSKSTTICTKGVQNGDQAAGLQILMS